MSLEGKVAIVTGVSAGLGAGIVRVFSGLGMHVVGMARSDISKLEFREQTKSASGSFGFVQGDVAQEEDCRKLVDTCLQKHSRVDFLINNAAITGVPPFLPIEDVSADTLRKVMEINLFGPFFMAKHVLPAMKKQKDGVIINIASVNAVFGTALFSSYNASKAAVVHLGHTIATEGARYNIRCNNIILGSVKSKMNEAAEIAIAQTAAGTTAQPTPEQLARHARSWMEPDDVASAISLLCRPEARLITGADINIDGGILAGVMSTYAQKVASKRLFD